MTRKQYESLLLFIRQNGICAGIICIDCVGFKGGYCRYADMDNKKLLIKLNIILDEYYRDLERLIVDGQQYEQN